MTVIPCSTATGKWVELSPQGPSPPPRTLHSSCLSRPGTSPLVVFGGGATGSMPVDDRNVYTLDQGEDGESVGGEGGVVGPK